MEVENKGKPLFPSNYVTIHQLRQRWLQQHQQSPSTVIPESNHRDESSSSKKPPQNDAVSAHSSTQPPVTKSPSSYPNNNNNKPHFSSISSSSSSGGCGFKKKPQNDAVSSSPPAKTKSPSSSSSSSQHHQQQQSSSSLLLPTTVISESNYRDNDVVVDSSSSSTAVFKKPQNDAVFARSSPPPVTKSTSSYNTENRASVESSSSTSKNPQNDAVSARFSKSPSSYYAKNKTPFKSISSSSSGGGFNKKQQNDTVSPSSPLISQQNPHNRIASKTLKETIFGKSRGPHRAPTPQKPEPEPKHTDSVEVTATTNSSNNLGTDFANDDKPISVSNDNQVLKKKKRIRKKKNLVRVLPDQNVTGANSLSETDPKLELEVETMVVGEKEHESGELGGGRKLNIMGQELGEVVVEKKQKPRESRGRRNWGKKGEGEVKVKTASFDQTKAGVDDDNVVEPKLEAEIEVVVEKEKESGELGGGRKSNKPVARESKMGHELEQVVVEKQQQQLGELRGRRNWDKKGEGEFKDKTASFDQNKQAVGDNAVEAGAEAEPELEEVVVWKGQESPELGGCRESNKKVVRETKMAPELEEVVDKKQILMETTGRRPVWKYKPKPPSFGQYDSNSNNVDNNVDVGVGGGGGGVKDVEDNKVVGNVDVVVVVGGGAVEDEKVVGNGDVVKENSRHASAKLDHQGQGQGQGKQSLKAALIDQDISESPVKERDAFSNNYNYNRRRNATGNGGSNWRMGYGRYRGHRIQRPSYSKPLIPTREGEVWVKKRGNPSNPTYHHLRKVPIAREDKADN